MNNNNSSMNDSFIKEAVYEKFNYEMKYIRPPMKLKKHY